MKIPQATVVALLKLQLMPAKEKHLKHSKEGNTLCAMCAYAQYVALHDALFAMTEVSATMMGRLTNTLTQLQQDGERELLSPPEAQVLVGLMDPVLGLALLELTKIITRCRQELLDHTNEWGDLIEKRAMEVDLHGGDKQPGGGN